MPAVEFGTLENLADSDSNAQVALYLVGCGFRVPGDLTIDGFSALRRSNRVYSLPYLHDIDEIARQQLDLAQFYSATEHRAISYRRMVDAILEGARNCPPVSFATYGHPQVGCDVGRMLVRQCQTEGIPYSVCAGRSSVEAICEILNLDPWVGLQVCESSRFLGEKIAPATSGTLFLTQFGAVGNSGGIMRDTPVDGSAFANLIGHLCQFYPQDHAVHIVVVGSMLTNTSVTTQPLGDLQMPANAGFAGTLVIPPVKR